MQYFDQFINLDYFFYQIYRALAWVGRLLFGVSPGESGDFWGWLTSRANLWKSLAELLVIFFLVVIIYSLIRIYEIRKEEKSKLDKVRVVIESAPRQNERWKVVLEHLDSESPSDWRLAIIEADNMLDEMVKKLGYEGEDLGERLKAVEPSDFDSLQSAWEAHKVRNQIVHEGIGFQITKPDAERVIDMYERVFREFEYI